LLCPIGSDRLCFHFHYIPGTFRFPSFFVLWPTDHWRMCFSTCNCLSIFCCCFCCSVLVLLHCNLIVCRVPWCFFLFWYDINHLDLGSSIWLHFVLITSSSVLSPNIGTWSERILTCKFWGYIVQSTKVSYKLKNRYWKFHSSDLFVWSTEGFECRH
jgi:hypothetical protein